MPSTDAAAPSPLLERHPRAATAAFALALVVAGAARFAWRGRQWFFQDEWVALAGRDLSVSSLLEPHNEHWFSLPALGYQVLYALVGLDTYLPYLAMAVAAHLAAGVAVWLVCRRVAPPWLAAAGGASFVLATSLMTVVSWYFLLTVALGLGQVLLADRDGPVDRRDAVGVLLGLAALMTTGVALVLVAAAGIVALVRRGWRPALVHVVPLAAIYLAWTLVYDPEAAPRGSAGLGAVARFAARAVGHSLGSLGGHDAVGVVLGVLALVGASASVVAVVRSWRDGGIPGSASSAGFPPAPSDGSLAPAADRGATGSRGGAAIGSSAVPGVLAGAAMAFAVITGIGRVGAFGTEFATRPRYALVIAALLLPAIVAGAAVVVDRVEVLALPAVALVMVGVVVTFGAPPLDIQGDVTPDRLRAWGAAEGPVSLVPPGVRPFDETGASEITVGWLREARRDGRLDGEPSAAAVDAVATEALVAVDVERPAAGSCEELDAPVAIELEAGQGVGVRGVVFYAADGPGSRATGVRGTSTPPEGATLLVTSGPTLLRVGPAPDEESAELCR